MFRKAKIIVIFFSALFVVYGLVGGMLNRVSAKDNAYQDLKIFTDILSKVREDYVEEPDMEKAMQGGDTGNDGGPGSLFEFHRSGDLSRDSAVQG